MKLYRSYECHVTVWLNQSEQECEQLRREQNYPFAVSSSVDGKKRRPISVIECTTEVEDCLILMRDKRVLLKLVPTSVQEQFNTRRIVSALES